MSPQLHRYFHRASRDHIRFRELERGFVPEILNTKIYDSVVPVDNDDAFEYARLISHTEGILVGISAGAALYAAIEWAKKPENRSARQS